MIKAEADFQPDFDFMKKLEEAENIVIEETADQVLSDLRLSQTMPFDTGHLQNESTDRKIDGDTIYLVSSTPYARRLYFHPEYHFRQDKNPNAGGRWFDPYLPGNDKGDFIENTCAALLEKRLS